MKNIGIDARLFSTSARGIGRYVYELIEHLDSNGPKHHYTLFMNSEGAKLWKAQNEKFFTKKIVDIPWYSLREQVKFSQKINREKVDLMHFPHYNVPSLYQGKYIVTIHDLLLHRHPTSNASTRNKLYFFIKYAAYRWVVRNAVKRSKKIIAVSEFTKKEIIEEYPKSFSKIQVIPEGITLKKVPELHKKVEDEYILYVGAVYPHKNILPTIKEIYPLLKQYKRKWYLVGKEDYFYKRLKHEVKRNKWDDYVTFIGEVSDEELAELYISAEALLFPSLYEGFGLPPLEAIGYGCPVVAYASQAVEEVLKGKGFLYKESNELEINLKRIFEKKYNHSEIEENQRLVKKEFSWSRMAKETESLYTIL